MSSTTGRKFGGSRNFFKLEKKNKTEDEVVGE